MAPATKGGMHFLARRAVVWFSPPKAAFILAPPRAPFLASAAILYNSRGRSPQPVREASAGPGQNPWRPGPSGPAAPSTLTPVRACQPSGILASTALRRSRSRPRRRAPEPSSPTGRIPQRWEKISSAPVSSSTSRSQCLFSASFLILSASFGTITLSV